jgi:hypothetical protein
MRNRHIKYQNSATALTPLSIACCNLQKFLLQHHEVLNATWSRERKMPPASHITRLPGCSLAGMLHRGRRHRSLARPISSRVAAPPASGTTYPATPLHHRLLVEDVASSSSSRPCLCGDAAVGLADASPG